MLQKEANKLSECTDDSFFFPEHIELLLQKCGISQPSPS